MLDPAEYDTVVVPAREEGFNRTFLGENAWHAIRMSSAMLDRIHYLATYQVSPISAITYYAEVERIEKYHDTGKYALYFKGPAQPIGPIPLPKNAPGLAPQAPRYTSFARLERAKTLKDVFG